MKRGHRDNILSMEMYGSAHVLWSCHAVPTEWAFGFAAPPSTQMAWELLLSMKHKPRTMLHSWTRAFKWSFASSSLSSPLSQMNTQHPKTSENQCNHWISARRQAGWPGTPVTIAQGEVSFYFAWSLKSETGFVAEAVVNPNRLKECKMNTTPSLNFLTGDIKRVKSTS